ncbi:hypothetical protein M433DRAFT_78687 [Acidomyces richmondensis BFW]|nr:MAG: hypothetical protein FE78DRAFT_152244 [Acidomyces sp. 'richmondensis']KYG40122.1 hypothetical protein M433DRAFT_78687 [Acidomyces richmondensis BFW]
MASDSQAAALLEQIARQGEEWKDGVSGAREALMGSCIQLHSMLLLPAETLILTQWAHPTHSAVLRLGSEINLFEVLDAEDGSPKTSNTIAARTNPRTEYTLVARMLRLLCAMGTVVETAQDTFAPTPFAKAMTREDFKDSVAFMHDDFNPCLVKETEYFKEINYKTPSSSLYAPFQYAYNCKGVHLFEYFGKFAPLMGKRFARMMQVWSEDRPKWFQEGYYPVKERLIKGATPSSGDGDETFLVDIGGGSGHDISQLLNLYGEELPGKLVLQDRPEIIQIAEKELGPEILKMSHDFTTEQPIKGARAYYLHSIIQDWDDTTNQQILRSIIPAMKLGYSKILINDYMIPNQGAHWLQTSLDWELMASLGSRHRTENEMRTMIEGVGLRISSIFKHPLSIDSLIELDLA